MYRFQDRIGNNLEEKSPNPAPLDYSTDWLLVCDDRDRRVDNTPFLFNRSFRWHSRQPPSLLE